KEQRASTDEQGHRFFGKPGDDRVRRIHRGLAAADDVHGRCARHLAEQILLVGRDGLYLSARERQWFLRLHVVAERLDELLRPDAERLALPRSAPDNHVAGLAADFLVRLVLAAEAIFDPDPRSERLEAMAQVREHLRARREMAAFLAEGPRDVSGGEER